MKILLLIRHAKSSWDEISLSDFDRPLNTRGFKNADEMAQRLKANINTIDAFIASPALRAKTTAEKFAAFFNVAADKIIFEKGLYMPKESFFETFIRGINNSFDTVAVFSHNPGITEFANTLTPLLKTDNIPTCGIFAVKADTDNWEDFFSVPPDLLFYDYPKLQS